MAIKLSIKPFGFHAVAFALMGYGCYYYFLFVNVPASVRTYTPGTTPEFGGKWKYLTVWNAVLLTSYLAVCLLNHVIGSSVFEDSRMTACQKFRDYFFSIVAFPLSLFVSSTFWVLYMIDRELVFPVSIDPYYPMWLNHLFHTVILLIVIVEMVLVYHRYPSKAKGLTGLVFFISLYLAWVFVIAYASNGHWVYPVLAVLNWGGRSAFMGGLVAFMAVLYLVGENTNSYLWGEKVSKVMSKRKR